MGLGECTMGKSSGNDGSGWSMSMWPRSSSSEHNDRWRPPATGQRRPKLRENPNHPKVDDGKVTRKVIIGGHTFSQTLTKTKPPHPRWVPAGIQTLIPRKK